MILISPTSGTITYNGRPLTAIDPESYRKEVGYCFPKTLFVCRKTVRNILFPYDIRGLEPDMSRMEYLSLIYYICHSNSYRAP